MPRGADVVSRPSGTRRPNGDVPSFELVRFECLDSGRGAAAVLQVSGRWRPTEPQDDPAPQLIIDDGRRPRRFPATPAPDPAPSQRAPWTGEFLVLARLLVVPGASFALETADGATFALPSPGVPPSLASDPPTAAERDSRAEADRAALRARVKLAHARVEERLAAERLARERLEAGVTQTRGGAQLARDEVAALSRELETERDRRGEAARARVLTRTTPDEVEPAAQPATDRRARVVVWTCLALALLTSAYFVMRAGRNIPIQEDWHVILAATGHQYGFWDWVWLPNNEHRVPIAKLVYVSLFQMWPDFRVGMIFNLAAMAGMAAAFVVFMRRLRGRTRWTDAFFPLIFLHLGNWENFGWSWELTFVIAGVMAVAILMLLASRGPWTTTRAALLVGCLVVTPFTGATALPFAAAVAVALLLEARRVAGRARTVLIAGGLVTLLLTALYFVRLPESTWVPGNPGLLTDLLTGGKFLALGLGPAAGGWWMVSILAVTGALASATWLLWRQRDLRPWGLLAFLAAGLALAVSLGRGRSGAVEFYGMPDRYVLVAIPLICAIYIVWELYGGARVRRLGPAALCVTMLLLVPLNTIYGAQWKDWYQDRVDTFAADIEAGVPLAQLIRYRPIGQDAQEMALSMVYMREYKIGVFEKVGLVPKPVRAWRIDAFAAGGGGWQSLSGPTSRASLVTTRGQPEMRWEYNATSSAPAAVGRSFGRPANWNGAGGLAFTVTGQATGRRVRVRLTVDAPDGGVERFDTWFTDDTAKPKTLVVPWNGFGRANARGQFVDVLRGPLPLTGIRSVTFIIGDPGPGVLRIGRLALTPGHPQLGWPLHSAAQRRSLPPFR